MIFSIFNEIKLFFL